MKVANFPVQIKNKEGYEIYYKNPVKADFSYFILNTYTGISRYENLENDSKNSYYFYSDMPVNELPEPNLKKNEQVKSLYIKILE